MEARSARDHPSLPPPRWPWAVALVAVIVVAGGTAWLFVLRDDETTVRGPQGSPFTVTAPAGWESVPPGELGETPGSPVAVLRQTDGEGVVVVNEEARLRQPLQKLGEELPMELEERFSDFRLTSSRRVTIEAGRALSVSYARTEEGTANTLLVVPAGDRSYALNAVVPAGGDEAAVEAGSILASFDVVARSPG